MRRGRPLCLALALASCAHQSSLAVDSSVRETGVSSHEAATDTVQEQKIEQGKKSIWTYEFAPLTGPDTSRADPDQSPSPMPVPPAMRTQAGRGTQHTAPAGFPASPNNLPRHGALLKLTVEEDDPVTATASTVTATRAEDKVAQTTAGTTKSVAKDESHPELPGLKCGFGGSVLALALLGLVVGGLLLAWKMKWLG